MHPARRVFLQRAALVAASAFARVPLAKAAPAPRFPAYPFALGVASGQVVMPGNIEANYAASMLEWARQTFDGRMAYSAVTTDTVATLLGRPPINLEDWARQHRSNIGA